MTADFSVVVPTFRRNEELIEALESVLQQDDVSVEVIVVDDSPEGGAESAIQKVSDSRVTYLKNPTPTGGRPSVVRNLGWPLARGRFVHFLDDDDIIPQGHYAAVKAAFVANPAIGLVFGRIEPFGSGPAEQLAHERRYFAEQAHKARQCSRFGSRFAFAGRMMFGSTLLVCSSSAIRRDSLERLGGFDKQIRLAEDAEFHVRAMRECGALFLDRTALHYRIHGVSLMHSPNPTREQKEDEARGFQEARLKYRKQHGLLEFYALKLFTQTVLRIL